MLNNYVRVLVGVVFPLPTAIYITFHSVILSLLSILLSTLIFQIYLVNNYRIDYCCSD